VKDLDISLGIAEVKDQGAVEVVIVVEVVVDTVEGTQGLEADQMTEIEEGDLGHIQEAILEIDRIETDHDLDQEIGDIDQMLKKDVPEASKTRRDQNQDQNRDQNQDHEAVQEMTEKIKENQDPNHDQDQEVHKGGRAEMIKENPDQEVGLTTEMMQVLQQPVVPNMIRKFQTTVVERVLMKSNQSKSVLTMVNG